MTLSASWGSPALSVWRTRQGAKSKFRLTTATPGLGTPLRLCHRLDLLRRDIRAEDLT
jgi:hypothetical protein